MGEMESLLRARARQPSVAKIAMKSRHCRQAQRYASVVAGVALERKTVRKQLARGGVVGLERGEETDCEQRVRSHLCGNPWHAWCVEEFAEPLTALCFVPTQVPESPQGRGQTQPQRCIAGLGQRPLECRANVAQIALVPVEPGLLLRSEELDLKCLGPRSQKSSTPPFQTGSLAARLKAVERILTNRLQHAEARLTVDRRRCANQVLVDQRRDPIEQHLCGVAFSGRSARRVDHGCRGRERPVAHEDPELSEEHSLGAGQQIVAPIDGRPQRAVSSWLLARTSG